MSKNKNYAAIVSTVKNIEPVVQSFIEYHLGIGFHHIFLFFDDPDDPSIETAARYEQVTVVRHDPDLREKWRHTVTYKVLPQFVEYLDKQVASRQILNVEIAIGMCREMEIDWLLHIDHDELFFSPQDSVREHFEKLSNTEYGSMTYSNLEALPESVELDDFFKQVTLFRTNDNHLSLEQRNLLKTASDRYLPFIAYNHGKSAGRVSPNLIPSTVHGYHCYPPPGASADGPAQFRKGFSSAGSANPVILHYPSCGFQAFWDKYQILGDFEDKWFGFVDIRSSIPFHVEARDVVQKGDLREARAFYEERCVATAKERVDHWIERGLLSRIFAPSELLTRKSQTAEYSPRLSRAVK